MFIENVRSSTPLILEWRVKLNVSWYPDPISILLFYPTQIFWKRLVKAFPLILKPFLIHTP